MPSVVGGRKGPAIPRRSWPICIHTDICSLTEILVGEMCLFVYVYLCGTPGHGLGEGVCRTLSQGLAFGSLGVCVAPPGLKHRGRWGWGPLCLGWG